MSDKLPMKAMFLCKEPELNPTECVVEKVIEMDKSEFNSFMSNTTRDNWYIRQYTDLIIKNTTGEERHCLLFLNSDSGDGILVNTEGASYARYVQFIPHAADILLGQKMTESEKLLHWLLTETVNAHINGIIEKGEFDMNKLIGSEGINEVMCRAMSEIAAKHPAIAAVNHKDGILSVEKAPLVITKLYCPLKVEEDEGDGYPEETTSRSIIDYEDEINEAIDKSMRFEGAEDIWLKRGLIAYTDSERLNALVRSAFPSVEERNRKLYGVITVESFGELSSDDLYELTDEITGQLSDGWGEGFEQQKLGLGDYDYYISFWGARNYFLKPESEVFPQQNMTMKM